MSAYQDLLKDSSKVDPGDKNYFIVTITDLDVNNTYPLQFRWKREGGAFSVWSAAKIITTPGESVPGEPSLPTGSVTGEPGLIRVTWNGTDAAGKTISNIDRVDIYVDGGIFDGTKPTSSFKSAGTQTIAAPSGEYFVTLYSVTSYGKKSAVSSARSVVVPGIGTTILNPQDPSAPTIEAGLASIIVSWNGKKSDGISDFPTGTFASAKVYIGTSADFVPSDNNWVHSLNFANGTNQVAIGVGTVIDKNAQTKLQYGVPYYVKIKTVNAAVPPVETTTAVVSSPTNITVEKLPASEIKTGFLEADAYIKAGASGGARVEIGGSTTPLVIYGTNGTTKLLEFIGGNTGTLAINGSGTFTGSLSIGSGNTVFKADPDSLTTPGIWLGNADYLSAPFRVSKTGSLTASAGYIGGWKLLDNSLQNDAGTLKINSGSDPAIYLGPASGQHIRLTPDSIAHYNGSGTTGKFTLTASNGNVSMLGNLTAGSTITGAVITSVGANPNDFTGTLTIDSGTITQTNQLYFNTPFIYANTSQVYLQSGNGYFALEEDGGVILGQGNASGDLQIRLNNKTDIPGYVRGYLFHSLYSNFADTTTLYTTTSYGTPGSTVTINANNRLSRGRTLYSGNISSAATLDDYLGGAFTGDLYFSTA
jgi:hypothetical protein